MITEAMASRDESGRAGTPGIARKVSCWVCGCDLTFNAVRLQAGAFRIHLYCKRCRRTRLMELKLQPEDALVVFGATPAAETVTNDE